MKATQDNDDIFAVAYIKYSIQAQALFPEYGYWAEIHGEKIITVADVVCQIVGEKSTLIQYPLQFEKVQEHNASDLHDARVTEYCIDYFDRNFKLPDFTDSKNFNIGAGQLFSGMMKIA